jgi:hypothetical protein
VADMSFECIRRRHEIWCGIADAIVLFGQLGASFLDLAAFYLVSYSVGDLVVTAAVSDDLAAAASRQRSGGEPAV